MVHPILEYILPAWSSSDAKSKVKINYYFSDDFEGKVCVHDGPVLSPLIYIIVLEALSQKLCNRCTASSSSSSSVILY